jgi:hypothetical protein
MGSGEDAYGVLSVDPTGEHVEVGELARYGAGLLRFARGRWFVRVLAERETAETRAAVLAIGVEMADAIAGRSAPPDMLRLLPPDALQPDSATYFHTQVTLNQLYFLSNENLLSLGPETKAVMADYCAGEGEAKLLVVRYPSAARCSAARDALLEKYFECARPWPQPAITCIEDGGFAGVEARPPHLVAVFDAPSAASAEDLLVEALGNLPGGDDNG